MLVVCLFAGPGVYSHMKLGPVMLAFCHHWQQYAGMGVQITIRDVPEAVRDELASRAAREGKSMQEFLRQAMENLASKPSPEQWVTSVRERKKISGSDVSSRSILQARDRDRR